MKFYGNGKFKVKRIDSLKDLNIGDIVCIKKESSLFNKNSNKGIKKGVLVKKNKKKSFLSKETCIIYDINTLSMPDDELISKILKYFKDNESDIINGTFEFINKFSQGEAVYLIKEKKEA